MTTKKKSKATRRLADKDRYASLKEYVCGKIGEMRDCSECLLSDHQDNHLTDIENYVNQLDAEGSH